MALKSIEELMAVLGQPCKTCKKINWNGTYNNGKYACVKNEFGRAVFSCDLGIHQRGESADFVVSEEQIRGLEPEMKRFLERRPSLLDADTFPIPEELGAYYKQATLLLEKVLTYASFARLDLSMEISGLCHHCIGQAPIEIRRNRIYIVCPSCTSMVADSSC